ncbi:HU family DNA-binding protein [Daejeonella sp.]|jgi:hypothetical protein|uniref:HU family DNA-binding protein n=1 Tax=Daejeonella sp. TaxID=2805397 RepID=UPI0037836135
MELGQYIVDLLRGQDEVSVIGLGTFTKMRVSGYFDPNSNLFYPPFYKISFQEIEKEDFSLIQHISSKENLNQASAEEEIKSFASGILNSLENDNSIEIKDLGQFHKNDGILSFEPINYLESNENNLKLIPVQELTTNKSNSTTKQKEQEITPTVDVAESPSNAIQEKGSTEDLEEVSEETSQTRSWLKIFIGFIIFLATLTALFYLNEDFNTFIKNKSVGLFSQADSTNQENTILIDSTKINADSLNIAVDSASIIADSLQQTKDSSITATIDTLNKVLSNDYPTFEIISAAFTKKTEAEAYMKMLSKKGIQSKVVENMPGKMLKISLGTFLDEESAKIELHRIHKEINKEAWIARVKPSKKTN